MDQALSRLLEFESDAVKSGLKLHGATTVCVGISELGIGH
jgi:hypothetical protein